MLQHKLGSDTATPLEGLDHTSDVLKWGSGK